MNKTWQSENVVENSDSVEGRRAKGKIKINENMKSKKNK